MSAHTPGPWKWTVNPKSHEVELSRGGVGDIVMGFERWGMMSATPRFRVDGQMKRAVDVSVAEPGREHHAAWWRIIDHPDARLIEAAPDLLGALRTLRASVVANNGMHDGSGRTVAEFIDAAIAKATGGKS